MHIFALTIFALTSIATMGLGIGFGYLAISGFLKSFGRHKQRGEGPATTALHAPAAGD